MSSCRATNANTLHIDLSPLFSDDDEGDERLDELNRRCEEGFKKLAARMKQRKNELAAKTSDGVGAPAVKES